MKTNLVYLDAVKMESIQDVVNAAARASRDLKNLLKQLPIKKSMLLNGKEKIKKNDFNSPDLGMREIWKDPEQCLWKLLENIKILITVVKKEMKDLLNGTNKIPKKEECMIEQCMLWKRGNLLDQINVLSVKKNVLLMRIMKIIQNPMMSFGYVLHAISIYITNQNITLREQARKLRKKMRCSEPKRKLWEMLRNEASAYENRLISNRMWQAGGKARFIYLPPGYNNDPYLTDNKAFADLKSSLIVLKTPPDNAEGDKVQAFERMAA